MDALAQQCVAGSKVAFSASSSALRMRRRRRRSCILTPLPPKKFAACYAVLVHRRPVQLLSCSSSSDAAATEVQEDELAPAAETPVLALASEFFSELPTETTEDTKTVRVRFVLQKECSFGQQFFVVGDDPNCGLWDTEKAVPMEWSSGHIWTAELALPVEREILFKFFLKGYQEEILWQSGPDRSLKTWNTDKTIVVSEDWHSPELQKVTEEEEEVAIKLVVEEGGGTKIDRGSSTVVVMDHQMKIPEAEKNPEAAEMNTEIESCEDKVLVTGTELISASGSGLESSHEVMPEKEVAEVTLDEAERYNSSQSSGEEMMDDDASQQSKDGEKSEEMLISGGALSEEKTLADYDFQNDIQWVFQMLKRVHTILDRGSQFPTET